MALRTLVFEPEVLTPEVMARFWAKTRRAGSGCLEWTATRSPFGYGRFWTKEGNLQAHRVAIVWAKQESIPSGMDVDHLCRNTSCVEPTHLRVATRRENLINSTHPGAATAAGETCQRGHDLTEPRALSKAVDGFTCRLCGNGRSSEYGKRPGAMERRNERNRKRRAADPEWVERMREYDRQRYLKKKAREARKGER